MKFRLLPALLFALAVAAAGQYVPNRWGGVRRFPHGYVDLANLDVHLVFPIYSRNTNTRAQLEAELVYDSDIWQDQYGAWEPVGGSLHATPGWRFQANTGAVVRESQGTGWCYQNGVPTGDYSTTQYTFVAPDGTTAAAGTYTTGCEGTSGTSTTVTVQASGDTYTVYTNSSGAVSANDSEGDNVLGEFEDPSGNTVSASTSPNSFEGTYTDPLGTSLTITGTYPYDYTYTGPDGSPTTIVENFETINAAANFGCYTAFSGTITVVQSIQYPGVGTYSFGYDSAGKMDSLTLPTGGTIYFNSTESCLSGTVSGTLSRWESVDGSGKPWSWSNNGTQTTETSPAGNQALYSFNAGVLGSVEQAQGPLAGGTGVSVTTISSTWGDNYIASQTATTELLGNTPLYSVQSVDFDQDGEVTSSSATDWGTSSTGGPMLRSSSATRSVSADGADLLQTRTLTGYYSAAHTDSQTSWIYNGSDEATSTTQQTGSASLTTSYTYNPNGTLKTVTAPNGAVTTFSNFACGNGLFAQSVSDNGILTSGAAWNCTGGVQTSATDADGNTTSYAYGGPGNTWLPTTVTIPGPYATTYTYNFPTNAPASVERAMTFGGSIANTLTTTDALGRPILVQHREGPSSSWYDSVETQYDAMGRVPR